MIILNFNQIHGIYPTYYWDLLYEWPLVQNPVFQAHRSNISHLTDETVLVELSASSVVPPSQGCEAWIDVSICFCKGGEQTTYGVCRDK